MGTNRPGLIGAVLAATLFVAVPVSAQVLDVPVFDGGYGLAPYLETARQFEALRPGSSIRLYGDPRIEDRLRVRVIGGSFPDAASAGYVPWPQLIRAGKVLDLTPYLDGPNWEGDARWRDTFLPGALDSWRIGGRVYGIPFAYSCWTLFYNRGLFRAHGWTEPRTWDEFFALCDSIRAAGIAPVSLPGARGLYPDAFLRAAFYSLAGARGWREINDFAPGAYLDPRFVRAAALLQRVTRDFTLRGWEGEIHTGAERDFFDGRAAMTVSGSWLLNEMRGNIPEGFELGAMNFPVFPGGAGDPTAVQTGSDCFFAFATGDPARERLAVDFLRFMTSRARAEAFVRGSDAPVAVRGVPISAYSSAMRDTAEMIAGARESFNMPQVMLQPPAFRETLITYRDRLMTGEITAPEFAARLEEAAADERARLRDPERVEYRHPAAGGLLLAALAAAGMFLVARVLRRPRAHEATAGGGRLRTPVAACFIGPALLLYGAFVAAPALATFGWAFLRWDGIGPRHWAGLFNFKWLLFENDSFWLALRNNLFLVAVPPLLVIPLALFFAALIHRGIWGAGAFRVIFLFPNLLGGIAATLLWLGAYEPHGGLVNAGLSGLGKLLHIGALARMDGFPWLSPNHLYPALVPIYIWMACGFNLVLFLAAMEGVDPQLYEAAELEGASRLGQFFGITLPLIIEVVGIAAVFLVIGGLNAFEMIWILTLQDPSEATHTLGTLLVTTMFKDFEIGRAAALAVVLFVLVAAATAAVRRGFRREGAES